MILDFCDTLWRSLAFQDNPDRPYPTLLFQLTRSKPVLFSVCTHKNAPLQQCYHSNSHVTLFSFGRGFLESRSLHSPDDRLSIIHHPALLGYVRNFYVQVDFLAPKFALVKLNCCLFPQTQPSHTRLQPEAIWLEVCMATLINLFYS